MVPVVVVPVVVPVVAPEAVTGLKGNPAQYFSNACEILRFVSALSVLPLLAAEIFCFCACAISSRQILFAIVVIFDIVIIANIAFIINMVHLEKFRIRAKFYLPNCFPLPISTGSGTCSGVQGGKMIV